MVEIIMVPRSIEDKRRGVATIFTRFCEKRRAGHVERKQRVSTTGSFGHISGTIEWSLETKGKIGSHHMLTVETATGHFGLEGVSCHFIFGTDGVPNVSE